MDNYTYKRSQKGLGYVSGQFLRGDDKWVGGYITAEGAWGSHRGGGDGQGNGNGYGVGLLYYHISTDVFIMRDNGAIPGRSDGYGRGITYHYSNLPFIPIEITIGWTHE